MMLKKKNGRRYVGLYRENLIVKPMPITLSAKDIIDDDSWYDLMLSYLLSLLDIGYTGLLVSDEASSICTKSTIQCRGRII